MTFGAVIDALAAIGAGTCLYVAIVGLGRLLRPTARPFSRVREKSPPPGEDPGVAGGGRADEGLRRGSFNNDPVGASADVPPDHVAAIAAAVAALGAGLKVVRIADAATGRDWVAEGRWAHQTSHQAPRRPH